MKRGRALVAAAALAASGCGGDGRTPLVVYSPHGRDLLQLVEAEFERREPGIDFRFLDMGSQEVYDRVRSERANPQGDVWFGGPDAIFARAAAEGLLAPYRPAWAEAVPASSRAPGDLYFGTYRTLPVLVRALTASAAGIGRKGGGLYAANTFGAIVGALLSSFLFIPNLGIKGTALAAAALAAAEPTTATAGQ